MDRLKVKELMRPVDEFQRISSNATFMEALETLDRADLAFRSGNAPERIVLVMGERGRIVGKLSPIDVVRALEPNFAPIDNIKPGFHTRLAQASLDAMKEQLRVWHKPLTKLRQKAERIKIRDFITMPRADQMTQAEDTVNKAFHLFIVGRHGSLFVQDGREIVGLIRFSDVYRKIREAIHVSSAPALEAVAAPA